MTLRQEFPILKTGVTYLDTAASAQKPQRVLDALQDFYTTHYSNVHRGLHRLAEAATIKYEGARKVAAKFLGAETEYEIVFTKSATEALNLVAHGLALDEEDRVLTTLLDHHSVFVPFQQAARAAGAEFSVIPADKEGIDMEAAKEEIAKGCTVLAAAHLSNATGTVQDLETLAQLVHEQGGVLVADGAQAAAHLDIDVQALGVDAYAFSGHKVYGPSGIGVLYATESLLERMRPYQYGGEMIDEVTVEETTFAAPPKKYEAGTPPIAQAAGLSEALLWLVEHHDLLEEEQGVVDYCREELDKLDYITRYSADESVGLVSFTVRDVHAHDVAQYLDGEGVAVRAGHHCTQPLHDSWDEPATVRASFGVYNTRDDVDRLIDALEACVEAFDV